MLALRSSRTVTVSALPSRLANIRAVQPSYRGYKGSGRHRLKQRAVLRCTHVGCGIDVGPFVQQDRHGVCLTLATGEHQGCPTILQRVEGVRKT
jgi:hypothetical protein